MKYRNVLILVVMWLGMLQPSLAQSVVSWQLVDPPATAAAGERFDVTLRAEIQPGWHLYSMNVPAGGPVPTSITVQDSMIFTEAGEPREPTPIPWFDQNFNMETNYFRDQADFVVPIEVKPTATVGLQTLVLQARFMACNDRSCLPPQTKEVSAQIQVNPGVASEAGMTTARLAAPPEGSSGTPATGGESALPATGGVSRASAAASGAGGESSLPAGFLAYLWFAMTMGALALLTPCVFPMIPITVSYFTKREAQSRGRTVFEAGLYSLGIIATFTLLGFALTFAFGAGGINRLAANPFVNIVIALVFVVFALSLFGVVELRLPSSWLSAVNRKSSQSSGLIGILLMALTFSLTSFTCTVPFVGTVMVAALQGDFLWSLLGVTAFAAVFSLPFFVLAIFPSWLQSLPKSGNWMNSVKIVMGFLELAAALKFISNVDLVYQWQFITRPVFITFWLAIGLVAVVYLLGWIHFPHESPPESVGAGRVLSAIFFLAVTLYLLRGLFGFGLGELDAFLPPRDYGAVSEAGFFTGLSPARQDEVWLSRYDEALSRARTEDRPLFVDFTGYTCTNCRWMEANMFSQPEVQELFGRFVLVRLYTDGTEAIHDENRKMEEDRFSTIALPFYALISPDDQPIATFPGLTRDKQEFLDFLRKGLPPGAQTSAGQITAK
jgi:thiol:disulfide interchange protein